jgi:Arc/MetJ-type ribon-helix-helix transcriptional regulator
MKKIGVLNKLTRESPDLTKTLSQAMWEYTFQEKLKNKSELIREGLEKALRKED